MTSEYLGKLFMGYDRLVSRRADGTLIRLITPVGQNVKSAQARLTSIARLVIPVLPQFFPVELNGGLHESVACCSANWTSATGSPSTLHGLGNDYR